MDLFHLSSNNLDGNTLTPRIPNNFFTKNGYEEDNTVRVCFSNKIEGCLMGISANVLDKEFYVHVPENANKLKIKKPNKKEVPDVNITDQIWVLEKVKLKCIGKIKVIGDGGDIKFTYGKNVAYNVKWKWKWLNKNHISESVNILMEEIEQWIKE